MNIFLKILLGIIIVFILVKINDRKTKYRSANTGKKRSKNVMEEQCREIFEDIFGVEFVSIRPDWLKNPETKRNLELDGYNPNIKTAIGTGVAFEYNGSQHSYFNPHFHKSHGHFISQVRRDQY